MDEDDEYVEYIAVFRERFGILPPIRRAPYEMLTIV
jgi:hypothetical protein